MSKVLFIYIDNMTSSGFSTGLGVASLSGYLKKHEVSSDLVYYRDNSDMNYLKSKVCGNEFDIIAFYGTASACETIKEISKAVRMHTNALLVYGGIHVMSNPLILFDLDLDAVCIGCGEVPLLELCKKKDRKNIPGIYFKKDSSIETDFKPYFPPEELFDEFLDFDYEIFLKELNRFPDFRKEDYRLEIIFNRGCPFSCAFCSNHVLNRIYGGRTIKPSPDASIEALKRALNKTGFKQVEIHDDTFTLDKKWFRAFIKRYIEEIGLPFQCNLRANCFDDEDAFLLKKANIQIAWLGLESGNEHIRNSVMKKGVTDSQLVKALGILNKHNIHVITQNMVGVPGETPENFFDTVRFNARFNHGDTMLSIFYPYPGTELYKTCVEQGCLKDKKMQKGERTESIIELPDFPRERIQYFFNSFQEMLKYEKQRLISSCMPELNDSNVEEMLKKFKTNAVWPFDLGSLKSTQPVSRAYGLDRGNSIDRYYIEDFLKKHAADIHGKCLDILNSHYTIRLGSNLEVVDVLDIDPENSHATVVTDLRNAECINSNVYDCFICTQIFHLIDDFESALKESHRILKDGGVLLATIPCISRCDVASGNNNDFWRMTPAGAKYVFGKVFGDENIEIFTYGNAKTGMAFWEGLAQEDLEEEDFNCTDEDFPVLVGVRAVKGKFRKSEQQTKKITKSEANCAVLLYHRVTEFENDPDMLCVTPENFKRHLSFLSRKYEILKPAEFGKCLERNAWPSRESVVITFDDGYADNFKHAAPILQQYGAGAFFFASSGYIDSDREFWWDELQKYIYNGKSELIIPAGYLMPDFRAEIITENQKEKCYNYLVNMMKSLNAGKINEILNYLMDWSGLSRTAREANRPMTEKELKALDQIPGMEVGAHTISHTRLAQMSIFQQSRELEGDAENLSRILGRHIRTLSYPFGTRAEQTDATYNISALAGYDFAFINDGNKLSSKSLLRMELSRFIVRNWSIPELRSNLDNIFAAYPENGNSNSSFAMINEKLVKVRLTNLFENGIGKVAVFGVGQHTIWLLALLRVLKFPEPVALLDDNAPTDGGTILGVKYCKPDGISSNDFECIIISSDCHFSKLAESAGKSFPDKKLINLYEELQPAAYPKRKVEHILNGVC